MLHCSIGQNKQILCHTCPALILDRKQNIQFFRSKKKIFLFGEASFSTNKFSPQSFDTKKQLVFFINVCSPAVEPEGGKVRRNLPIAIFGKPPDVISSLYISYHKHHMRSHSSLSWKSTKIITVMKTKTRKKLRKGKDISTKIIIQSRQFMSDDTSVNVSGMMVTT